MSEHASAQLIAALELDAGLRSRILAAGSLEDLVAIAAAHGLAISTDDIRTLARQSDEAKRGELDDASLTAVVGGGGESKEGTAAAAARDRSQGTRDSIRKMLDVIYSWTNTKVT
jgi:predicted ribosomally synthesized peptide with nif11-like leader